MSSLQTIEFDELCEYIFSQDPPKDPHTIQLQFDEIPDTKYLYQELLQIFTYGMKKFYGDANGIVKLHTLTERNINLIRQYLHSIGIDFKFKAQHINDIPMELGEPNEVEPTELSEHIFTVQSSELVYSISFDFLSL